MKNSILKNHLIVGALLSASLWFVGCSGEAETKSTAAKSESVTAETAKAEPAKKESVEKSLAKTLKSGGGKGDKLGGDKGSKLTRSSPRPTGRARPAVPVKVTRLEKGEISSALVFDSVLETESSVEIFSESQGVILEVMVEVGDRVEKGQILAQLESEEQQLNVEENRTRYEQEKLTFARTKGLMERKLINLQEFERASFNLEQARLRHERAVIGLENTVVRATVEGVVTERLAQVGRRVTSNRVLFELMNLDELFASVNAPGQYLLSVEQGLRAEIESDLIDGVSYEAYVKIVSPVVDPASGTFKAKVAVKNDNDLPIYPGMFVNVRVIVDTRTDTVLVPKEAVVHEGDLKYVYRVRNSRAQKILFEEGYSTLKQVESLNEFIEGDEVIVLGQSALKHGALVKVVRDEIASEETVADATASTEG